MREHRWQQTAGRLIEKAERAAAELQPNLIEELCIHIYKQRKKINLASERQGYRPFVSVARGG